MSKSHYSITIPHKDDYLFLAKEGASVHAQVCQASEHRARQ